MSTRPLPIPTRGGTRAPNIPPSPGTLALIESIRADFEARYPKKAKSLTTHRQDGTSRRQKHVPKEGRV